MFVAAPRTPEQLEALALSTYIDGLSRRIENREYELDDDIVPRSPSPPPEYDRYGKRTNTRERRKLRELETERTLAVYLAFETIPNYVPPVNFSKLTRSVEKFYLPVHDYPHINFIGLLLGPRGNNLRRMETESGAKISIRGRGSVKEGSGAARQNGQEEDLHCAITAISPESIKLAFDLIQEVVDTAVETPEHQNDFKRLQLRQLAELNGTLRDYENQICGFCRQPGHRKFECPERQAMMDQAECRICKERGHFAKNCTNASSKETSNNESEEDKESKSAVEEFLRDIDTDKLEELSKESNRDEDAIGPPGVAAGEPVMLAPPPGLDLKPPGLDTTDSVTENLGATEAPTSLPPPPPPSFTLPPPPATRKLPSES